MTELDDVGMRKGRGGAKFGDANLEKIRGYEERDPRVSFMSVFPVSMSAQDMACSDVLA